MQKEKIPKKEKETASENKENQKPLNNQINGNRIANKNLHELKIQIEIRKEENENNFLNSEKNLNLNSKESNLNVNVKRIENVFEDNLFVAENLMNNPLNKKNNFLSNNNKQNQIANHLLIAKAPLTNAIEENLANNNNNNNHNFLSNSVNNSEFFEAPKDICNLNAEKGKLSDFIFLKKKLTRDDKAKIKEEFLDNNQKLKVKKQSKRKKRINIDNNINNKALTKEKVLFGDNLECSHDIEEEEKENENPENVQIEDFPQAVNSLQMNNEINNNNINNNFNHLKTKPVKNFFDIFLSEDDPFIQAAKLNQKNSINSNLFKINKKTNANPQQTKTLQNSSISNSNNNNNNNLISKPSSNENLINFNIDDSNYIHNNEQQQLQQQPISIRKNFIENSYQILQKGFDLQDLQNSNNKKRELSKNKGKYAFNLIANPPSFVKSKSKSKKNILAKKVSAFDNLESNKENICPNKNNNKNIKNFSPLLVNAKPLIDDLIPEEEKMQISDSSNNNYNRNKYWVKTRSHSSKGGSSRKTKLFGCLLSQEEIAGLEKIKKKIVFPLRSKSKCGSENNSAYNNNKNEFFEGLFVEAFAENKNLAFDNFNFDAEKNKNNKNNCNNIKNEGKEFSECLKQNHSLEDFKKTLLSFGNLKLEISQESRVQYLRGARACAQQAKPLGANKQKENSKKKIALLNPFISSGQILQENNYVEIAEKSKEENRYNHILEKLAYAQLKSCNINNNNNNNNNSSNENNFNLLGDLDIFNNKSAYNNKNYNQQYPNYNSNNNHNNLIIKSTYKNNNKNNSKNSNYYNVNYNCHSNFNNNITNKSNFAFNNFKAASYSSLKKYQNRRKSITLEILKSNVSLSSINTTFIVTEDGLATSQRSKGNDFISVGRQQVNDEGLRPNDIMLFPTDPSISRSHFKILFKNFFEEETLFFEKLQVLLGLLYVPVRETRKLKIKKSACDYCECDCDFGKSNVKCNEFGFYKTGELDCFCFDKCQRKEEEMNIFGFDFANKGACGNRNDFYFGSKLNAMHYNFNEDELLYKGNYGVACNKGLECDDAEAYFACVAEESKNNLANEEFEDKKQSESFFITNFFAAADCKNNPKNDNKSEKGKQQKKQIADFKSNFSKEAADKLLIAKNGFPPIKFTVGTNITVSPFLANLNKAKKQNFLEFEKSIAEENPNFENNQNQKYNKANKTTVNTPKNVNYISKITPNVIFDIVKYLLPKEEVFIEDNSTIYGTYVRIKPYSVDNLISNVYFIYSCLNVYNSVNNFSFENALHVLLNNEKNFKIIGAELFKDFNFKNTTAAENALNKEKNSSKSLNFNNEFAIRLSQQEKSGSLIKECNVENSVFYNFENANLLESLRRKYLFEKCDEEERNFFINKDGFGCYLSLNGNNANNFSVNEGKNNYGGNGFNCDFNYNYNNNNSNQINNCFKKEESFLPNNFNSNANNNSYLSNFNFNNNNNNNKNNNLASYCNLSQNANDNNNHNKTKIENQNKFITELSELEEINYSRQNTDFGLDCLKENFSNLNLKEPKSQVYTNDLNLGKSLDNALLIINKQSDKESEKPKATEIYFKNNFFENSAKENCLVSAYMLLNRKKTERLNNQGFEKELFSLFLNKKKIDFLLRNFANEAFNPYNPNSTTIFEFNSAKASADNFVNFGSLASSGVFNRINALNTENNYRLLGAAAKKTFSDKGLISNYTAANNINSNHNNNNPNSYTNQKQQQIQFHSNSSNPINPCNNNHNNSNNNNYNNSNNFNINSNNNQGNKLSASNANYPTNNINNLTSTFLTNDSNPKNKSDPFHSLYPTNKSISNSNSPSFNPSNYPSLEFLNYFLENSQNFLANKSFSNRFHQQNLTFLQSHIASAQQSRNTKINFTSALTAKSLSETFTKNNFILRSESVFLNSAKSGFIVSKISSCFEEILKAIKLENQEFYNAETQSSKIEFISFDKFFEFQKLDLNSREYKGEIEKNVLFNSQGIFKKKNFFCKSENEKSFSFLYLVETSGDPCGIMNRQREIVFAASKLRKIENNKLFTFNNRAGFLLGNEINCSVYHRDWEAQAFLAYEPLFDKWTVSDLTCFLKPNIFYAKDYHGLWICVSADKRSLNRFGNVRYAVKSGDEVKISETVMSVCFDYKC